MLMKQQRQPNAAFRRTPPSAATPLSLKAAPRLVDTNLAAIGPRRSSDSSRMVAAPTSPPPGPSVQAAVQPAATARASAVSDLAKNTPATKVPNSTTNNTTPSRGDTSGLSEDAFQQCLSTVKKVPVTVFTPSPLSKSGGSQSVPPVSTHVLMPQLQRQQDGTKKGVSKGLGSPLTARRIVLRSDEHSDPSESLFDSGDDDVDPSPKRLRPLPTARALGDPAAPMQTGPKPLDNAAPRSARAVHQKTSSAGAAQPPLSSFEAPSSTDEGVSGDDEFILAVGTPEGLPTSQKHAQTSSTIAAASTRSHVLYTPNRIPVKEKVSVAALVSAQPVPQLRAMAPSSPLPSPKKCAPSSTTTSPHLQPSALQRALRADDQSALATADPTAEGTFGNVSVASADSSCTFASEMCGDDDDGSAMHYEQPPLAAALTVPRSEATASSDSAGTHAAVAAQPFVMSKYADSVPVRKLSAACAAPPPSSPTRLHLAPASHASLVLALSEPADRLSVPQRAAASADDTRLSARRPVAPLGINNPATALSTLVNDLDIALSTTPAANHSQQPLSVLHAANNVHPQARHASPSLQRQASVASVERAASAVSSCNAATDTDDLEPHLSTFRGLDRASSSDPQPMPPAARDSPRRSYPTSSRQSPMLDSIHASNGFRRSSSGGPQGNGSFHLPPQEPFLVREPIFNIVNSSFAGTNTAASNRTPPLSEQTPTVTTNGGDKPDSRASSSDTQQSSSSHEDDRFATPMDVPENTIGSAKPEAPVGDVTSACQTPATALTAFTSEPIPTSSVDAACDTGELEVGISYPSDIPDSQFCGLDASLRSDDPSPFGEANDAGLHPDAADRHLGAHDATSLTATAGVSSPGGLRRDGSRPVFVGRGPASPRPVAAHRAAPPAETAHEPCSPKHAASPHSPRRPLAALPSQERRSLGRRDDVNDASSLEVSALTNVVKVDPRSDALDATLPFNGNVSDRTATPPPCRDYSPQHVVVLDPLPVGEHESAAMSADPEDNLYGGGVSMEEYEILEQHLEAEDNAAAQTRSSDALDASSCIALSFPFAASGAATLSSGIVRPPTQGDDETVACDMEQDADAGHEEALRVHSRAAYIPLRVAPRIADAMPFQFDDYDVIVLSAQQQAAARQHQRLLATPADRRCEPSPRTASGHLPRDAAAFENVFGFARDDHCTKSSTGRRQRVIGDMSRCVPIVNPSIVKSLFGDEQTSSSADAAGIGESNTLSNALKEGLSPVGGLKLRVVKPSTLESGTALHALPTHHKVNGGDVCVMPPSENGWPAVYPDQVSMLEQVPSFPPQLSQPIDDETAEAEWRRLLRDSESSLHGKPTAWDRLPQIVVPAHRPWDAFSAAAAAAPLAAGLLPPRTAATQAAVKCPPEVTSTSCQATEVGSVDVCPSRQQLFAPVPTPLKPAAAFAADDSIVFTLPPQPSAGGPVTTREALPAVAVDANETNTELMFRVVPQHDSVSGRHDNSVAARVARSAPLVSPGVESPLRVVALSNIPVEEIHRDADETTGLRAGATPDVGGVVTPTNPRNVVVPSFEELSSTRREQRLRNIQTALSSIERNRPHTAVAREATRKHLFDAISAVPPVALPSSVERTAPARVASPVVLPAKVVVVQSDASTAPLSVAPFLRDLRSMVASLKHASSSLPHTDEGTRRPRAVHHEGAADDHPLRPPPLFAVQPHAFHVVAAPDVHFETDGDNSSMRSA